jgi:hypothetical protein
MQKLLATRYFRNLWVLTACLLLAAPAAADEPGRRGRLANRGFENQRIQTTLFFAGQARDGSSPYGVRPRPNVHLYTVHPLDARHLNWSVARANRDYALDCMAKAGINVITMSSWGERSLSHDVGWVAGAPMQTAPEAHDELFEAAAGKHLLIMPLIESRGDWAFRDEFPHAADGRVAPGTVSQIKDLMQRYLKNPKHPEWADRWARIYDRRGIPRFAIVIIHAASSRLGPNDHKAFADGIEHIAREIFQTTKIRIGFFLDVLPPNTNAPGRFRPGARATGPRLLATDAVLGVQCFLPEVWLGACDQAKRIQWKRDFCAGWFKSGLPLIMDVSPGYDNTLVFPKHKLTYGFDAAWRDALTGMVADFGRNGIVFNSWNGYTEGMAAVPTREHQQLYYRWLRDLNGMH